MQKKIKKIKNKLDPKININKSYLPSSIKVDENGGEECILNSFNQQYT
jgi:hypothetical protein